MDDLIRKIETILYEKAIKMESVSIQEDLGAIIFESTLYKYSKDEKYKEKTKVLINKLIKVFPKSDFGAGFIEGFEGIYWAIFYAYKCNILDSYDILADIEPYLFSSIEQDIENNNFDLLYGSIGKILFYLESDLDIDKRNNLINKILISLFNNRIENEKGIFWYDIEEGENLINLGIAHGLPSILIFLIRLKTVQYKNLEKVIKGYDFIGSFPNFL